MAWELWWAEAVEVLAAQLAQVEAGGEPVGERRGLVELDGLPVRLKPWVAVAAAVGLEFFAGVEVDHDGLPLALVGFAGVGVVVPWWPGLEAVADGVEVAPP